MTIDGRNKNPYTIINYSKIPDIQNKHRINVPVACDTLFDKNSGKRDI